MEGRKIEEKFENLLCVLSCDDQMKISLKRSFFLLSFDLVFLFYK